MGRLESVKHPDFHPPSKSRVILWKNLKQQQNPSNPFATTGNHAWRPPHAQEENFREDIQLWGLILLEVFCVFEQSAISYIYDQHRIKWFIITFVLVNYINVFKHHLVRVSRCELLLEDNFKVSGVGFFSVGFSPARWAPVFHLQHPSIQKIDAFYRSCISMSYMLFICISYVDTQKKLCMRTNPKKYSKKRCNSPWLSAPHFFRPIFWRVKPQRFWMKLMFCGMWEAVLDDLLLEDFNWDPPSVWG